MEEAGYKTLRRILIIFCSCRNRCGTLGHLCKPSF